MTVENEIQERDSLIMHLNNKLEEDTLRYQAIIDNERNKVIALDDEIAKYKEDIDTACSTLDYMNK